MEDIEEWRPVVGYEGAYEVSSLGRVRSVPRVIETSDGRTRHQPGKMLRQHHNKGYPFVRLSLGGHPVNGMIHRLVAAAFLGPEDGAEVCHNNGDPSDCTVANLRYGTRSDNVLDSVRHGTHPWAGRTQCPQEHPYDDENTRWYQGRRYCRECHRIRNRLARLATHTTPGGFA
jgi:hypothetical protein